MKQSGRYDFSDGGSYCGEWLDSKFQGYGICTGPRGQGRYSGKWLNGYETSGIYSWPNAHTYEGCWSSGKRHGLGVENKDKWIYKGEWTRGMKGRYGGRYSRTSKACYEGTWSTGLQDGYGVETYADKGTYKGQWFQGMRHGHGVRESVAYDQAVHFKPQLKFQKPQPRNKSIESSLTSIYSDNDGAKFDMARRDRKLETGRGGFVLEQTMFNRDGVSLGGYSSRSADEWSVEGVKAEKRLGENITKTLVKTLKFKKKGPNNAKSLPQSATSSPIRGTIGSVRSLASAGSCRSDRTESQTSFVTQNIDGSVTEIYAGEWKNDKRCGYGSCSRSDGLKYEGEWYNNKKNGCGMTTYQDGWVEEGKYKDNVLVTAAANKKSSIFAIRMARLRDQIDTGTLEARKAGQIAMQKTEVAINRMKMARMKVDAAMQSSEQAKSSSTSAHQISATCCNSLITDASLVDPNLLQNTSISVYSTNKKDLNSDASATKKENAPSAFKQIFNTSLKRSFSRSKNSSNHSVKSKSNSFKDNKTADVTDFSETSKYFDLSNRSLDRQNIAIISPETRAFPTHIAGSTYIDKVKNSKDNFQPYNFSQITSPSAQQNDFQHQQQYQIQQNQQFQPPQYQQQNPPQYPQQNLHQQQQPSTQLQQQPQSNFTQNISRQQQPSQQQARPFQTQAIERSRLKRNKDPFDVFIGGSIKSPSNLPSPSFLSTSLSTQSRIHSQLSIDHQPSIMNWLRSQLSWFLLVLTNSLFALFILWLLQRSLV